MCSRTGLNVLTLAAVCLVGGCAIGPAANRANDSSQALAEAAEPSEKPLQSQARIEPTPALTPAPETGQATVTDIVPTGLDRLCCLTALASGDLLAGVRDTGEIYRVAPDTGTVSHVGTLSGVAFGEGTYRLLALAAAPDDPEALYTYYTQSSSAIVDRYWLDWEKPEGEQIAWTTWTMLRDLPMPADPADGGALALGPDGTLYAGGAGGEVLRTETDGGIPDDSPVPGSATYSSGHGDIATGLAWDAAGRGWAVDSGGVLRAVVPGAAGVGEPLAHIDPARGFAQVGGSLWAGTAYGGLWRIPLDGQGGLSGAPERLTNVGSVAALVPAGSEALWVLTTEGDIRRVAVS